MISYVLQQHGSQMIIVCYRTLLMRTSFPNKEQQIFNIKSFPKVQQVPKCSCSISNHLVISEEQTNFS